MADAITFTPEQNAKLNEAMAIFAESNDTWQRLLAVIANGFGEKAARAIATYERELFWSGDDLTLATTQARLASKVDDILRTAMREKITQALIDDFIEGLNISHNVPRHATGDKEK